MGRLLLWRFSWVVCHVWMHGRDELQHVNLGIALSTIPAILYTLVERGILGMNTTVLGSRYENNQEAYRNSVLMQSTSIWVFTLLAMEAIKAYKTNPSFQIATVKIPTWTTPLIIVVFTSVLVPNTSLLGHLCGLVFGYGCELSFVRV
jgi:glycosylphosphatidylinositol transamidase